MASPGGEPTGCGDEVDLIDLEGGPPAPRHDAADATPEEQEHLLDVCPPKLEQKLSLTRRSHEPRDLREYDAAGNVLVTLGHDQVVPVRRRIDVVSSDTIKRVRDITKNLEPVMGASPEDEETTRQINDAFDFLAELEDGEEQCAEELERRPRPPLEELVFENRAFESSPPGKGGAAGDSPRNSSGLGLDLDGGLRSARDSFKRLRSFTCSVASFGLDAAEPWRKRANNACPSYRKSWSEGSSAARRRPNAGDGVEVFSGTRGRVASASFRCPKGQRPERLLGAGTESPASVRGSCSGSASSSPAASCCTSSSSSASSCSEVDWSWVEEVEPDGLAGSPKRRSAAQAAEDPPPSRCGSAPGKGGRMRAPQPGARRDDASVAMSVAAAGKTPTDAPNVATAAAAEAAAEAAAAVADECADAGLLRGADAAADAGGARGGSSAPAIVQGNGGTLPWLRASMRRLRQLRMPENACSNAAGVSNNPASVSAPNSLPDIALIAPEILAAQTNDTSGGLLRPSSAPAHGRSSLGATGSQSGPTSAPSPRRGRRSLAGRCQQQQQQQQQQQTRQQPPPPPPPALILNAGTTGASGESSTSTTTCTSSPGTATTLSSGDSVGSTPVHRAVSSSPSRRVCGQRDADRDEERGEDEEEEENPLGKWPHALSPALACLGCTLGLFNISRFAILSIQFGANFVTQFLILSLVIGIPLLTLQVCLGQRLSAGVVDMWKISPLFQGVGIALLLGQAFIGIYSIVGVSWMFVYFRDSFVTKVDRYRWAEPFPLYREETRPSSGPGATASQPNNHSAAAAYKLQETVPDYFSGLVLQRHHLNEPDPGVVTLKFQVAFNLAVVWMIVFVSLSKGLRSYGKVVYVFTLLPILGTLLLCTKLLGLTPPGSVNQLFPATVWNEFFLNGRSWVAASSEVFLTWGLLGAAAMQIAAHNKHKHLLQRDTGLVIVLTLVVLLLAAFLANTCVQILKYHGYIYVTSSFERIGSYGFLRPVNQPAPAAYASTPERFMAHASFLVGQRVTRPGSEPSHESGYQALRLPTELVPATLALLGTDLVSPFWAVLFYFTLILFGIAQQLAIWHCVITGIMAINTKMMKLWETTITFFSCACAYVLGLPMATELGIYVVYYLDYTVGGAWWIMVLYLVQVGAVFAVRGRPHTGDAVVTELFPPTGRCLRYWAAPLLSFTWNVILPIMLTVVSITIFKSTGYRDLYSYRRSSKDYWAIWSRQLGASMQLIPILIIPIVALVQTCRYLNTGPPDIFDRIQLLYRPPLDPDDPQHGIQTQLGGAGPGAGLHGNGLVSSTTELPFEDPPPKYTPPPSYTTATGARIAKMLRQSFRRSVRRIANVLGEGGSGPRQRPALQHPSQQQQQPPPPDYAAVLVEMNQSMSSRDVAVHLNAGVQPDVADTRQQQQPPPTTTTVTTGRRADAGSARQASLTIDRSTCRGFVSTIGGQHRQQPAHRGHYTVDRNAGRRPHLYNSGNPSSASSSSASNLTAAEVANLLRSSIRRGTARTQQTLRRSFQHHETGRNGTTIEQREAQGAASVENLVEAAVPIYQDSSMIVPKQQQQPPMTTTATNEAVDSGIPLVPGDQQHHHHQPSSTTTTTGNGTTTSPSDCDEQQLRIADVKKTADGPESKVSVI